MPFVAVIIGFLASLFTNIFIALGKTLLFAVVLAGVFFGALWIFGIDLFVELFDYILQFAIYILNAFDLSFDSFDFSQYIDVLPAEVRELLSLVGLTQATSIIIGAIIIKFSLRLIPFVRGLF